jgi:hypothetical protein
MVIPKTSQHGKHVFDNRPMLFIFGNVNEHTLISSCKMLKRGNLHGIPWNTIAIFVFPH